MNSDRWEQILATVRSTFEVEDSGRETSEERGGTEIEYIIFSGPMGRLRLEFLTHGVRTSMKTLYKKRIGADITVEETYNPNEKVSQFSVWKWDEVTDDWQPFNAPMFN